ncbi:hypothetical protein XU18_4325 [Perkinsela sp. CCAP 1560/4]|nr:hypothetical protein XU18_4325 [Perkinsela sp. CCAP 1560/4]|eukprot:KNH04466.1 hypothetical protein XU18_4325 [Perkinsela sp. CCAP 1560/4]
MWQLRTDCKRPRVDEHNEQGKRRKHLGCWNTEWGDIQPPQVLRSLDMNRGCTSSSDDGIKRRDSEHVTHENNGQQFSDLCLHQQLIDASNNGRSIRIQGINLAQPRLQGYANINSFIPISEPEKPLLLEWNPNPQRESTSHRTRKRSTGEFTEEDAIFPPKKPKSLNG